MQIEDLTLLKCLGKGSFGEVFLSTKKGKKELFATKKIDRVKADQPSIKKYFENEIKILNSLQHPNIVKLEDLKMTKDYYYIVMEYINGGSLTDCLKTYKNKYNKSFPEQIVQYLMRQIVDAIKYLHGLKIIHRDLKLDNIMVNFDNDNDKNMLNMMNAKIKIIDFGFAIHLSKSNLAFSALGSPINMDPTILKKFTKNGGDINQLGYDFKADIWSLGTICYEMLIGQAVFNAETMNDLVKKVENGNYSVPTSVSGEMVSFLNGMLQYDSNNRLSAEELSKHPFLTKRISDFTKIDTKRVQKKISNQGLNINVRRNQTIWSIFNEEEKLINIKGGRDLPAPEGPISDENFFNKRRNTDTNIPRVNNKNQQSNNNINKNYHKSNTIQYPTFSEINQGKSFYGQTMSPNNGGRQPMTGINQINNIQNSGIQRQAMSGMHQNLPGMQNQNLLGMQMRRQTMPGLHTQNLPEMQMNMKTGVQTPAMMGMQQPTMPGMQAPLMPGMQPPNMPGMGYNPMMNYPSFGVPMPYNYGGGMYPNNNPITPVSIPSGYTPLDNDDDDGRTCSIQ